MSATSYAEILEFARQLPPKDQIELAEALLRNLRSVLQSVPGEPAERELVPLIGMSVRELQTLAQAIVAPGDQEQLQALLEKNRNDTLSADEQETLGILLAEVDQVALLKARALYTLKISGLSPETEV